MYTNTLVEVKKEFDDVVQQPVMPASGCKSSHKKKLRYIAEHVLPALWQDDNSYPFREPVNPVALNIPHYFRVIKVPMDLSTVRKRLENAFYRKASEAVRDLRTIFVNCNVFNPPNHPIVARSKKLQTILEDKLSRMPKYEVSLEDNVNKVEPSPMSQDFGASFKVCNIILDELRREKHLPYAFPFLEPLVVNSERLQKYLDVIKQPMDLQTVALKLQQGVYKGPFDFVADVRLIFTNCYTFNDANNPITQMAHKLEDLFETMVDEWIVQPTIPLERYLYYSMKQRKLRLKIRKVRLDQANARQRRAAAKCKHEMEDVQQSPCDVVEPIDELVQPKFTENMKLELVTMFGLVNEDQKAEFMRLATSELLPTDGNDYFKLCIQQLGPSAIAKIHRYAAKCLFLGCDPFGKHFIKNY